MKRFFMLLFFSTLVGCNNDTSTQKELIVSSAASLKDAMTEIEGKFEEENPSINLLFNYGGSGTLAQQIVNGAPSDVFLSASQKDIQILKEKNLLENNSIIQFAQNELTLIVPTSSTTIKDFHDLTNSNVSRIAIGEPSSVPVGQYGKELLQSLKIWSEIEGKLVYAKDVRQVLSYVESGNVDAGIVYVTDSHISVNVEVIETADPSMHSPILYPAAQIKNSQMKQEGQLFLQYLKGAEAQEILTKYHFKQNE